MITRKIYLKEPEKWVGTPDEKELIDFCVDYIKNHPRFHFSFSPQIVDINNIYYPNHHSQEIDAYFLKLSREVIKKYNETRKKR